MNSTKGVNQFNRVSMRGSVITDPQPHGQYASVFQMENVRENSSCRIWVYVPQPVYSLDFYKGDEVVLVDAVLFCSSETGISLAVQKDGPDVSVVRRKCNYGVEEADDFLF